MTDEERNRDNAARAMNVAVKLVEAKATRKPKKFSRVVSSVKQSTNYGSTYWVLTLECGHPARAVYQLRGWRASKCKPAPVRVVCGKCNQE